MSNLATYNPNPTMYRYIITAAFLERSIRSKSNNRKKKHRKFLMFFFTTYCRTVVVL